MQSVARIGDTFSCGDTILTGSNNVLVENIGAAREGDQTTGHGVFPPTTIQSGSSTVRINNQPAARIGDPLVPHGHSGVINTGSSVVIAG